MNKNEVTIEDIISCYHTGIFDGEGCINISKSGELSVQISMTSKNILDKFQAYFGGNVSIQPKRKENSKQIWIWRIYSDKAILFLEMIQKYSIIKKTQVDMALDYQKNKLDGNINNRVSQSEHNKREFYKNQISELKSVEMTNIEKNNYNKLCMVNFDMGIINGNQKTLNFNDDDINIDNEIDNNITEIIPKDELYTKNIKNLNVGYYSGFFDAEGSLGIYKKRNSYTLQTSVENTNYSVLQLFYEKYNVGKIYVRKKQKDNHKQAWQWYFQSNNAIPFLQKIHPYTIEKREQIRLAIEFQEWYNNQNIKPGRGNKLTSDQIKICDWYVKKLKDLKQEEEEDINNNENKNLKNVDKNQGLLEF